MLEEFNKLNSIFHFTVGMVISLVFNRFIYGNMIMVYSFFIGLQTFFLNTTLFEGTGHLVFTQIPALIMLFIVTLTSVFVISKSSSDKQNKIITTSQLGASIFSLVIIKILKQTDPLFNGAYIRHLPTLFFLGFLISVSILPDNQPILNQTYIRYKQKIKK